MKLPYVDRFPFSPMNPDFAEVGDPDTIVEQSGWRSTDKILGDMQDAGRRLQAFRLGDFDTSAEISDEDLDEPPVFRNIGADFVDLTQDANRATLAALRLKEVKNEETMREANDKAFKADGKSSGDMSEGTSNKEEVGKPIS